MCIKKLSITPVNKLGLSWATLGFSVGSSAVIRFWGPLIMVKNFYFLCILQFWLLVLTQFWALVLHFFHISGVEVGLKKYFGVYSCSWATFVFYVSLNSDNWFWLNFWIIFTFSGPYRAIFGVGEGSKHCFGDYSCSWTTLFFYVTLDSDIWFWLNFGVIFDSLGP